MELTAVEITGNRVLDTASLLEQVGQVVGRRFDLAGLNALAQRVQARYRASGYVFASAFLPPQDLRSGVLRIEVIEGQYGAVRATSADPVLEQGAQAFLAHGLRPGDPVQNQKLERTLLILDDQPGAQIRPVIRPGAQTGEGDLTVSLARSQRYSGEVAVDNIGARSTGEYRARAAVSINSPFVFGDKVTLNTMVTDEAMWLGSLDYERPLGPSGLRGQLGYAHTNYQLGGAFAALEARGLAKVTTARVSYPVVRSQARNLLLFGSVLHKELSDEYGAIDTTVKKRSDTALLGAQFDDRDAFLGGGLLYGSLVLTTGRLWLDSAAAATDEATARTRGAFSKVNLDIARIQQVSGPVTAYARVSAQWARNNLDSSEKFNLGGYYGVRSYPLGEGTGDQGLFAQMEIRYSFGAITPFAFYDWGTSRANVSPWDASSGTKTTISGTGVGVRSLLGAWSIDGTIGWRGRDGGSPADNGDDSPRVFLMVGRRF